MILTNDHVVEDEEKAIVNFADGDVRSADVIARDSGLDIALFTNPRKRVFRIALDFRLSMEKRRIRLHHRQSFIFQSHRERREDLGHVGE